MKMLKNFLLTILFSSQAFFASEFVCTNDPIIDDYLNAKRSDITGAIKYATQSSCDSSCKTLSACAYSASDLTNQMVFSPANFLNESTAIEAVNTLKAKKILSFTVTKDGVEKKVVPTNQTLFSTIGFPVTTPTIGAPKITSTYNVGNNTIVKLSKLLATTPDEKELTDTNITVSKINTLKNSAQPGADGFGIKYIAVDGEKIEIDVNGKLISDIPSGATSHTLYISADGNYYVKFKEVTTGGNTETYIEYKNGGSVKTAFKNNNSGTLAFGTSKYTSTILYAMDFNIDSISYAMEAGQFLDSTGTMYIQHWVSLKADFANNGYICSMFSGGTDIGGDLSGNLFSTQVGCDLKCEIKHGCIEWKESDCKIVSSLETAPVTDYTGKNINTKKIYSWECSKTESSLERCDAYAITQNDGKLNYALSGAGWETKDHSAGFGQAIASTYMMEQMQHIWSGWNGYCENGTKYDSSWMSDPMTLMSFAMMAYDQFEFVTTGVDGAVQAGSEYANQVAESVKTTATEVSNQIQSTTTSMYESVTGATATTVTETATTGTGQAISSGTKWVADGYDYGKMTTPSMFDQLKATVDKYNTMFDFTVGDHLITMKYSDLVGVALSAMGETNTQDVQTADEYFKSTLNLASGTSEAVRYANCMASIGLSFPNLMAYSVDSSSTSPQLRAPWSNPMRVTFQEMANITAVMGPEFVAKHYMQKDVDADQEMMTIIALNGNALTQAGQIICAESPAVAASMNKLQAVPEDDAGGSAGAAMANAAIKMALSKIPPPYGFFAALAFQVLTSFSDGNACTDEKIATQWGPEQLRTNKALKGSQCHLTDKECVAKWFWGSCMRHGSWYCCYDQEITKIFVEGLKEQLGRGWDSCSDLTIYDLKNISFRPCTASESPQVNKCFPSGKYDELVNVIMKNASKNLDPEVIADQATSGLTLPGRDPWAQ